MQKRIFISTVLLFIAIIISRIIFLDADTVSISSLHNEDEGNYVYNIRNFIVEGTFFKDETNFILLSPLFSFFVFTFVKIFGISIFGFRFVSAFFALACIILGYWFLRNIKEKYALTFFLFLTSDFLFNIHSRIAMPEITVSFFFLSTFVLFIFAEKKEQRLIYFLTGFIAGLGFLVKANAVVIFATCACFIAFRLLFNFLKLRKLDITLLLRNLYKVVFLLLGLLVPILIWNIFIIKPNIDKFELVRIGLIQLHRPYLRQVISTPFLKTEIIEFAQGGEGYIWIYLAPYLLISLIGIFYLLRNKEKIKSSIFWLSLLWFLLGNLYFFYILV